MGISTSTGTLTAGQSRTFNLSPASAVTLTLSPNVRVTITETPATVAATGLGGNASRVHEPRLPGVVTYGPYPMGGSVLVENESNSGSSVAWVRSDSIIAESADGVQSLVSGAGNIAVLPGLTVSRPTALAAAFATYANFDIWRDGAGVVRHNFNRAAWCPTPDVQPWLTQNTYYVDGTSGADANNGSTWALAKKSISAAITVGNAAAAPYVVYVRAGTYVRAGGTALSWGTTAPSQPCAFIAVGGRATSTVSDLLTWALDTGTTYVATRSNATRVYDTATLDRFGDYTEIPQASPYTLAQCRLQPNSWFTNGTLVYVNRGDAAVVADANTRVYLTAVSGAKSTTSGNMYVNGFDFEGGNQYAFQASGNASGRVVVENCSFKYVTDTGAYNGFTVRQLTAAAAINCVSAQNPGDGFNANTESGALPFMLTIGCVGRSNGKTGNTSNNGLTTHSGMQLLDIAGMYHNNYGGNVAVVQAGTQAWLIGTRAFDSFGDTAFGGSIPSCDFQVDQSTPEIWLDGCVSSGSTYGVYKPSGTVNVRGGFISQGLNGATEY